MNSRIASSFCRTGRAGHGLDHRSQGCWLLWRCAAFLTLSSSLLCGTFAARRAEPAGRVAAHLVVRPHDEEERRISSVHDLLPVVLEEGALHTTASAVRRRSRDGRERLAPRNRTWLSFRARHFRTISASSAARDSTVCPSSLADKQAAVSTPEPSSSRHTEGLSELSRNDLGMGERALGERVRAGGALTSAQSSRQGASGRACSPSRRNGSWPPPRR